MNPRFSIVIPTFNRCRLLRRALDSALYQDACDDYEVVVVDDCSGDGTGEYLQNTKNPKLAVYRNPDRLSMGPTWNKAVRLSRGEFVFILQDDDLAMPNLLATASNSITRYSGIDLICFATCLMDEKEQNKWIYWQPNHEQFLPAPQALMLFARHWTISSTQVIFSRAVFDRYGGFDETLSIMSDAEAILRWMVHANTLLLPDVLALRRVWSGSVTAATQHTPAMTETMSTISQSIPRLAADSGHLNALQLRNLQLSLERTFVQPLSDIITQRKTKPYTYLACGPAQSVLDEFPVVVKTREEKVNSLKRIRLLIWCPRVNRGGGVRLLLQLVQALARQPSIDLVRLAVPVGSIAPGSLNPTNNVPIELFELTTEGRADGFPFWLRDGFPSWLRDGFQSWLKGGRFLGIKGTARLKHILRRWVLQAAADWQNVQLWQASRDCDLVYVFWPHRQVFPNIDRPVVCTFQDAIFFDFPEILRGVETKAEWKRAEVWLRKSAKVVVSSRATRATLVRHFGEYCSSAIVIPHAILPTAHSLEGSANSELLARLPQRYIVCPANITSHKNHHALLVAWSRFGQRKQYPLVLCGGGTQALNCKSPDWPDGWQAARLAGIVTRTGLRPGQDFYALGYIDDSDVMPLIGHATALIMPTLAEGGGSFPVEEALSLGIPVLCSDIPVLRQQLAGRSARIGWFDPESPDSIAQAVNALLENYREYKQSALNARNDTRPTWDDVAAQYVDVFRMIAEAERP